MCIDIQMDWERERERNSVQGRCVPFANSFRTNWTGTSVSYARPAAVTRTSSVARQPFLTDYATRAKRHTCGRTAAEIISPKTALKPSGRFRSKSAKAPLALYRFLTVDSRTIGFWTVFFFELSHTHASFEHDRSMSAIWRGGTT